jgi:hypothetical protein
MGLCVLCRWRQQRRRQQRQRLQRRYSLGRPATRSSCLSCNLQVLHLSSRHRPAQRACAPSVELRIDEPFRRDGSAPSADGTELNRPHSPAARDLVNRAFEDFKEDYKQRVQEELCTQGIYRLEGFGRIQQKWLVRYAAFDITGRASPDRLVM